MTAEEDTPFVIQTVGFDLDGDFASDCDDDKTDDGIEEESLGYFDDNVLNYNDQQRGIAIDEMLSNASGKFPSVDEWKDLDTDWCRVYLSKGNEEKWKRASAEINLLKDMLGEKFGSSAVSIDKLAEKFFGSQSKIFRVFYDELLWCHDEFMKFLGTFFVQCAYRISSNDLYFSRGFVDTSDLMGEAIYTQRWHEIARACLPNDEKARPLSGTAAFWMKLEAAINKLLAELVVKPLLSGKDGNAVEQLSIVVDDDKMHYNGRIKNAFLKFC